MSTQDLVSVLKDYRRRNDLRQSDVGERIGLSASEVSRIENGRRRFPLHLIDGWAEALGLRIEVAVLEGEDAGVHVSSDALASPG
ncbi:MAG: XRE family transcriptional regulator [Deltaproteobacteria bacterium]|nr:MAG: XRE family transcriptional regulator [Deltaproteobacteria bacterium]